MKFLKLKTYYFSVILLFPFVTFAQSENKSDFLTNDIEILLPPLQTLIASL